MAEGGGRKLQGVAWRLLAGESAPLHCSTFFCTCKGVYKNMKNETLRAHFLGNILRLVAPLSGSFVLPFYPCETLLS